MDEDAIAKAVKAAAGLGLLRAAVITHLDPDWPGEVREHPTANMHPSANTGVPSRAATVFLDAPAAARGSSDGLPSEQERTATATGSPPVLSRLPSTARKVRGVVVLCTDRAPLQSYCNQVFPDHIRTLGSRAVPVSSHTSADF